MSNSVFYYVDINTSADAITGYGNDISAFNYAQFLTQISKNDETDALNYFYIKGFRKILDTGITGTENRWIISKGNIEFNSWGSNPWRIECVGDFYFESILDWVSEIYVKNGIMECSPLSLKFSVSDDYVHMKFENCWIRADWNDGSDTRFSGGRIEFINCTLQNFKILMYNYNNLNFVNTIIYNPTSNLYYLIQNIPYTTLSFDNVISNRWIYEPTSAVQYNVLNPIGVNFTVSSSINSDDIWSIGVVPDVFNKSISAIAKEDILYTSSGFSLIDITGDQNYTSTWFNGRRDGIGALYFPEMSGFAVSANSATAPLLSPTNFVISGNNPFTVFSASSATYFWDDSTSNSAVNNNNVISHTFTTNGSYEVDAVIKSFNEWYSVTATSWTILIGSFNVTIVIYDRYGNDITGLSSKPLNVLTFSASVNGLAAGSYLWDLGDNYSATTQTYNQSYRVEGLKNIRLSAYALENPNTSAIDTSTITISATSAEYFVNIISDYDVCANNAGTSADPFNWSEFKDRVQTSGEYLDTYRLSGSRELTGTTSNRMLLNVDRTKNFTIRDWNVSAYGPWVIQAKDFSNIDKNSIISAAGCTLKNGIIYNKVFGTSPSKGGQITIGKTYDMFIVYQGNDSHIIVDPFRNILSGGSIVTSAESNIIGSTIYLSAGTISACQDNFISATYSATNQNTYKLELTDSVFVNFMKENNTSFSACNIYINNCVFNNTALNF